MNDDVKTECDVDPEIVEIVTPNDTLSNPANLCKYSF